MNGAQVRKVVVAGGTRIPFCRSNTKYMELSNKHMMTECLKGLVKQFGLEGKLLDEVVLGAVIKHSSDWNLARESVLGSGLSPHTPAFDIQRACGTSLEAALIIGGKIALGQIESGIAAGVDTTSDAPIVYQRAFAKRLLKMATAKTWQDRLKPFLGMNPKELLPDYPNVNEPRTGKSMGQHCELMAQQWKISRQEQDQLALESHQKAAGAYDRGFYKDLIMPFQGLKEDNNMRRGGSLEKLAKLKPAFERSEKGTMTAANSTPLTDGASAVILCSEEYAQQNNLPVLAYLTYGQSAAVDFVGGDGLLMAPTKAVSKMLTQANLSLQDFDFYEIHEAFAAQVLCTLRAWESEDYCKKHLGLDAPLGSIDRTKMNVNGGSLALGHPFAATGARIVATLAKALHENKGGRGLISVCTAGGMGVAAILEGVQS